MRGQISDTILHTAHGGVRKAVKAFPFGEEAAEEGALLCVRAALVRLLPEQYANLRPFLLRQVLKSPIYCAVLLLSNSRPTGFCLWISIISRLLWLLFLSYFMLHYFYLQYKIPLAMHKEMLYYIWAASRDG